MIQNERKMSWGNTVLKVIYALLFIFFAFGIFYPTGNEAYDTIAKGYGYFFCYLIIFFIYFPLRIIIPILLSLLCTFNFLFYTLFEAGLVPVRLALMFFGLGTVLPNAIIFEPHDCYTGLYDLNVYLKPWEYIWDIILIPIQGVHNLLMV